MKIYKSIANEIMIIRKKGETNKQWAERCQAYAKQLEENNRALRVLIADQRKSNPRTNKLYVDEAKEMFNALALIDHFLRNKNMEMVNVISSGVLHNLGFNEVEIHQDECLKDGAYNNEK